MFPALNSALPTELPIAGGGLRYAGRFLSSQQADSLLQLGGHGQLLTQSKLQSRFEHLSTV